MLPFWKFVGFAIYISIYLITAEGLHRWPKETLVEAGFKVLPVLQCVLTVASSTSQEPGYQRYKLRMLLGLTLCMLGDFLVVWKAYKIYGALFFMAAHCCYISAMGLKPLRFGPTFTSYFILAASAAIFVIPSMEEPLFASVMVCVYFGLVTSMAWRACVRFQYTRSLTSLCGALGGLVFYVSDTTLMVDRFVHGETWVHAPVVVMMTYYCAQFGLALSATDDFVPTMFDCEQEEKKYK